jgi:ABC-type transport system involved in cytochrome bd biosynthesis fused ATPase/permease subunit
LMPVLQDQFISIQRMYDVFAHRRGVAVLEPEQDTPIKSFALQRASISLNGSGSALTFPDMSVSHPETLCITGPSGSGKSTLLSALAGQRRLTTGILLVNGAPVDPCSILWREKCSFLPQEPELLPGRMIDNLDRFPGWTPTAEINAVIERLAKSTSAGKESQVGVDWEGVSVGQRRIIALLRCLGSDAPVLLLDEPVAGVDQHFVDLIKPVMEHAIAKGKIIIMSMHEHDQARLKINNTKLVYLGLNPAAEEQGEGA